MAKAERIQIEQSELDEYQATRPFPPKSLLALDSTADVIPAPEVELWIRETFLDMSSPLYNAEHEHLHEARIGCLWTSKHYARHQMDVMGLCEVPNVQGNTWLKTRMEQQLIEWFGAKPDFLLTFYAPFANAISNAEWCRLAEHELYHCGQQLDDFGMPKFTKEGEPKFGIRGHDVEEFVGIVRRYGVESCHAAVREFVEAANSEPEVARVNIASMCGTCLAKI